MPKKTSLIPQAPTARLLMNLGAERVSKKSMEYFSEILEDYALEISRKSIMVSKHSGRKTVKGKDVRLAVK